MIDRSSHAWKDWDWPSSLASNFRLEIAFQLVKPRWLPLTSNSSEGRKQFLYHFPQLIPVFSNGPYLHTPCQDGGNWRDIGRQKLRLPLINFKKYKTMDTPKTFLIRRFDYVAVIIRNDATEWRYVAVIIRNDATEWRYVAVIIRNDATELRYVAVIIRNDAMLQSSSGMTLRNDVMLQSSSGMTLCHSWWWLQHSRNVELKMLTVFGVSIVLYFL
jgi:hypothetical protein